MATLGVLGRQSGNRSGYTKGDVMIRRTAEDVLDDAPSVKQRLAEQMQDPEVVVDLLSCTRVRPPG